MNGNNGVHNFNFPDYASSSGTTPGDSIRITAVPMANSEATVSDISIGACTEIRELYQHS